MNCTYVCILHQFYKLTSITIKMKKKTTLTTNEKPYSCSKYRKMFMFSHLRVCHIFIRCCICVVLLETFLAYPLSCLFYTVWIRFILHSHCRTGQSEQFCSKPAKSCQLYGFIYYSTNRLCRQTCIWIVQWYKHLCTYLFALKAIQFFCIYFASFH